MVEHRTTRPPLEHKRIAQRRPLRATLQSRKGQARATVDLIDISTHGARLATVIGMRAGEVFWIKLPGLANQEARVVWRNGFVVGCAFVAPLYPAVVDRLLERR